MAGWTDLLPRWLLHWVFLLIPVFAALWIVLMAVLPSFSPLGQALENVGVFLGMIAVVAWFITLTALFGKWYMAEPTWWNRFGYVSAKHLESKEQRKGRRQTLRDKRRAYRDMKERGEPMPKDRIAQLEAEIARLDAQLTQTEKAG